MRLGNYLSMLTTPKLEYIKPQLNLSDEEEVIFDMLSRRKSRIQIADRLNVSTRTVDRLISRVQKKMLTIYE